MTTATTVTTVRTETTTRAIAIGARRRSTVLSLVVTVHEDLLLSRRAIADFEANSDDHEGYRGNFTRMTATDKDLLSDGVKQGPEGQ